MNERIRQLIEKAEDPEHGFIIPEKFAQLIVRECIDLALGSSHRDDDMGAIIANKIKKQFGVEE